MNNMLCPLYNQESIFHINLKVHLELLKHGGEWKDGVITREKMVGKDQMQINNIFPNHHVPKNDLPMLL